MNEYALTQLSPSRRGLDLHAFTQALIVLALGACLTACGQKEAPPKEGHASDKVGQPAAATGESKAKPALVVKTIQAHRASLADQIITQGSIAPWQEALISAEIAGLPLQAIHVQVGDKVRKGQLLAKLNDDTVNADVIAAMASLMEARANLGEAKRNAERARGLHDTGALSQQQIDQMLTSEVTAQARVQMAQAQLQQHSLRLKQTEIRSPDDGIIAARTATLGSVSTPGQELFRLIRGARLEYRAEVTARELNRISKGQSVQLAIDGGPQVTGTVRTIAPALDLTTRKGQVYVDLPAHAQVHAGMFARGTFALGQTQALCVPPTALVLRDGRQVVMQLEDDQRVRERIVQTGRRDAQCVEILEGLTPEARIVASGVGFLNDGDSVKVAP